MHCWRLALPTQYWLEQIIEHLVTEECAMSVRSAMNVRNAMSVRDAMSVRNAMSHDIMVDRRDGGTQVGRSHGGDGL